ncbi:YcaO-like family protein [Sphingomonas qilianensis]|uniref:YcaO-like family protein n=1 Tax=Sphingomonas qilianensis TaxID=1736690 RepID=A0ABU9XWN1_9SPHN
MRAGVTRLADLTGLTPLGIPVFQAVRPQSRSLSVSQGKGLTPMAAQVSALLEAVEHDLAERLVPEGPFQPLKKLAGEDICIWRTAPREAGAILLDPDVDRHWITATGLCNGRRYLAPWDLVSLDFMRSSATDVVPVSSGLATGNTRAEAVANAVAELVERDMSVLFNRSSPQERRRLELDLDSVDEPVVCAILRRFRAASCDLRVWSTGQLHSIAAFECALVWRANASLAPVGGSGCHTDRTTALLRALLEAAQALATAVAGARDDLSAADYGNTDARWFGIVFGSLSFGPGPVAWCDVQHHGETDATAQIDILLSVAGRRSSLPLMVIDHEPPMPTIAVVRVLAPGLLDCARAETSLSPPRSVPPPTVVRKTAGNRPVIFIGPSLPADQVPTAFEVLPPAICGDLARLLCKPPPAVALVDGCFAAAPSVWHHEILDLIAQGVTVYGAASLGALRAAELWAHGMIGVGVIFELYRHGLVTRDDAVMLSHAPAALGNRPLTIALVDAEAALLQAGLPAHERRMLQRIARTMPYDCRTWRACLAEYRKRTATLASVDPAKLADIPSFKAADVHMLLETMAAAKPILAPLS